jgi:hypothetical protein
MSKSCSLFSIASVILILSILTATPQLDAIKISPNSE